MGYLGHDFSLSLKKKFNKTLEIIKRPRKYYWSSDKSTNSEKNHNNTCNTGFKLQPIRWIVERTFAWIGKYRRLSKDYEFKIDHSENFIYLAMIRNMLRKIVNY
jgi:transposase